MSHIDFLVGFVLILSALFLIVYFVSNSISNNVNDLTMNEVRKSSLSLERQLFDINDDKSLITNARELQAVLTETNHTAHTEEIRISIKPQVNSTRVYNNSLGDIPSSSTQSPGETVLSFRLSFSPDEKKWIRIFYFGDSVANINYLTTENNVSLRMLSDKNTSIVSQEKILGFISNGYEKTKNILGFQNQFRIDVEDFHYGPQPPVAANVVSRSVPVLFESSDGSLHAELVRLVIW
jgi:hypothetical protein